MESFFGQINVKIALLSGVRTTVIWPFTAEPKALMRQ